MKSLDEVPAIRALMWTHPACQWNDHAWEQFVTVIDHGPHEHREPIVVAVLCAVCGWTPAEALGALPIHVQPADYPELPVKAR